MTEIAEYLRTRLATWRIAGLWLLVAAAAAIGGAPQSAAAAFRLASLTILLIVQLRLWDDLADLPHDRVYHAERVLVRAKSLRRFWSMLAAMMVVTAVALFADNDPWRIIAYIVMLGGLALLYHGGIAAKAGRAARTVLVLLKYPAIALLAASGPPALPGLSAAVVLYALVCAHDFNDMRHGATP